MTGIEQTVAERIRQVCEEKWTEEHDSQHCHGELTGAAISYAAQALGQVNGRSIFKPYPRCWPWDAQWWKPSDNPIRNLVKAGALIAAEIDRLQRASEVQS